MGSTTLTGALLTELPCWRCKKFFVIDRRNCGQYAIVLPPDVEALYVCKGLNNNNGFLSQDMIIVARRVGISDYKDVITEFGQNIIAKGCKHLVG